MRFAPGARTNWHSHVLGQTLHIVSGVALIGTRDGKIIETHPGETVSCPPNEEHWHGATPEQFMEHLALWEADGTDRNETEWMEPVTDNHYNGKRTNSRSLAYREPGSAVSWRAITTHKSSRKTSTEPKIFGGI